MGILKKILVSAVGAAASYYVTKVVTAALERKPLKARMRDGKSKVVDMKNEVMNKAMETKDTVAARAAEVKNNAVDKAKSLYDGGDNGYGHTDDNDKKDV